jgi:hypothetical protein
MNLRTPLLAIGAVLLLIGAIVLPVSAAGPYQGNTTDSQDCYGDRNMYQHQNSAMMRQAGTNQNSTALNPADTPASGADQNMYQHQYRIASGTAEDPTTTVSQGPLAHGNGQKQQGDTMKGGNGDRDHTRTQSHLHDGSCGNCPSL